MKLTKKMRKLRDGMNKATQEAFKEGHKPPQYFNITQPPMQPHFIKVGKGVPYVNPLNYQ